MPRLPDDILVRRVLAGDKEAFRHLVERHSGTVYAAIYSVLLSRMREGDVMDELMADTFTTAYASLGTLHKRDRFGPWVWRIAHHKAIDLARRSRWQLEHAPVDEAEGEDRRRLSAAGPAEQQDWEHETDVRGVVADALATLPDDLRVPVVLRYMRGLSMRAVSESLGVPIRTVERRVADARRRLRAYFAERGLTDEVMALQRCALPLVGAVDATAHVMHAVHSAPAPEHRGSAGGVAGASAPAWAVDAALVGVVTVALALVEGAMHTAPVATGESGTALVSFVDIGPTPLEAPPALSKPRGRRVVAESGDTLGTWRPVKPTSDAAAPIAGRDLAWGDGPGFLVSNKAGVYLDVGSLYGNVTLEAVVQIPMHCDAQATLGLVIAGQPEGVIDSAGGHQRRIDVSKHRRDVWVYLNPLVGGGGSLNYDGAAPDLSQPWVSVANAVQGWTHVRLVFHTARGAYDIYINGVLGARSVPAPATRDLPVTGVVVAASSQEVPSALRVAGIEVWVEQDSGDAPLQAVRLGTPIPGPALLAGYVRERVEGRQPRLAREALRELAASDAEAATLATAARLVAGLEAERERSAAGVQGRQRRLKAAVGRIARTGDALQGDDADAAYIRWLTSETDVAFAFCDRDWTGQGRAHALVALPRDDYLDEENPRIAAYWLQEAYFRLTGRAIDMEVRGAENLQHPVFNLPWDRDASDGLPTRREDVDALFAIVQDAARHFAIVGAIPKADTLISRHHDTRQARVAERLAAPFRRNLTADMSSAAASYASLERGIQALRASGRESSMSFPSWLGQHVPGAAALQGADGAWHVTLPAPMYYSTGDVMQVCRDLAEAAGLLCSADVEAVLLGVPGLPNSVIGMARVRRTPSSASGASDLAAAPNRAPRVTVQGRAASALRLVW